MRAFGDGEVGMRSLSALIGVATVPVAYLAARELVSERAAVVATALVAVNPLLIWYSQEARAYALLVLLSGIALYFFARALRDPSPRALALWALASVAALLTHYFAAFPFLGQAAWLLARPGARRRVAVAVAAPAFVGLALIPLALAQQGAIGVGDFISEIGLLSRAVQVPGFFLVGFELPVVLAFAAGGVAAALAAVGLWLLLSRGSPTERRGAAVAGSVGAAGLLIPLLLVPAGIDVFLYRNVLAALLPLAIVIAAGLGCARAGATGIAATTALLALCAAVALGTSSQPKYQRETWREAAVAIGGAMDQRAIVATPGLHGRRPLRYYLAGSRIIQAGSAMVGEVEVLALPRRGLGEIATARLPAVTAPPAPPAAGFRLIESRRTDEFLLFRYRAPRPKSLRYGQLAALAVPGEGTPVVVLQEGGGTLRP